MTGSDEDTARDDPCDQLRSILLEAGANRLERLAGFALGSLLGVQFRQARSGDQRGGDGGVSGIAGRHLIFEARRYGPNSRLDERSIRGEIDQAASRQLDLEAWILVTTQEVPQQLQDAMDEAALGRGIGAISVDWLPRPLPKLAVLAASCPEFFATEFGEHHRALLKKVAQLSGYASTLETIERELQSWSIGYDAVRDASHRRVREIWNSRRKAQAKFHQNVAGGEESAQHVRRSVPIDRLDAWVEGPDEGAVGALVGRDGVGKTWTALDWLQSRLDRLPIIVLASSSALGRGTHSDNDPAHIIGGYLREISGVRDVAYWEQRARRLLARPTDEGPVFLLFFDGLNQHPSRDWVGTLEQLEDEPFHRRARTLISTRTSFFEDRLHGLRGLIESPCRIDVGTYDVTPGGEFDLKLELAGLTRDDLPDHLVHLAVVPRMFDLIVCLRSELGDVGEVTVHRLLWAYGASAIQVSSAGAFSEKAWRRFLLELAADYRDGSLRSTRRRIETLSHSATLGPDEVYRRVSGVLDGVFTNLDREGDPEFDAEFVHHALGLALVARMEHLEPGEESATVLDQFLDPIAGYDDRAETLRASVNIALLRYDTEAPAWLGTLCARWLHSLNIPESHLNDLEVLAPKLVTPMLDVIEASCGLSLTRPRDIAIAVIGAVDKTDPSVASTIASRGSKWHSFISLELRGSESDQWEDSEHAQRHERLTERIGIAEPGVVTVAGRKFEIVDYRGDDLIVATAQMLQGRPLRDAVEFFVRGAIHFAVVGSGVTQETQSWLNLLNTADPEETASGLRSASQAVRSLDPQAGHHPELNARIASILLWRTGYSEDAEEAWKRDPKIDHYHRYETDYVPDPSRSMFRLERKDAAQVLCDKSLSIFRRIERAKDALLDPSFQIPPDFADELISSAETFPIDGTATGRNRTSEDLNWYALSLALARCNADHLAERERARLRQFAERSTALRIGSALAAPESMLLVRSEESAAIQALRERGRVEWDDDERTIQNNFLIAEVQSAPSVDQVTKILSSGLDSLYLDLGRACHSPSLREFDRLVQMYREDARALSRITTVLAEHDLDLSERAFDALSGLLFSDAEDVASGAAWVLLASNDAERLGKLLDQSSWSWLPSRRHVENMMGSAAIEASNHGAHLSDIAERIAPARLLGALSQDERSREEVALAVNVLSAALSQSLEDAPQSGLEIIHDDQAAATRSYEFTLGDIVEERADKNDMFSFVERMNRPERYAQRRQAITQSYIDAVRDARRSGAQLLHAHFSAEDFDLVLNLYPEALEPWLEGMDPPSSEFRKRVRLAEGFYAALCEAVLIRDPTRGIPLWRALRQCLTVGFINRIGIDRLKYAPFIASDCPAVDAVLEDLYGPDEAQTDDDLLDVVVAARSTGRIDWLRQMICRDETSPCPVHQRRAAFIRPLLTRPAIAGDAAWPSSKPVGGYREIRDCSWIMGQREAFAGHWMQKFAQADTPEIAYASWLLFMASSDRRGRTWISVDYDRYASEDAPIDAEKRRFMNQQRHQLEREIAENEKWLQQHFTNHRTSRNLLPWRAQ